MRWCASSVKFIATNYIFWFTHFSTDNSMVCNYLPLLLNNSLHTQALRRVDIGSVGWSRKVIWPKLTPHQQKRTICHTLKLFTSILSDYTFTVYPMSCMRLLFYEKNYHQILTTSYICIRFSATNYKNIEVLICLLCVHCTVYYHTEQVYPTSHFAVCRMQE